MRKASGRELVPGYLRELDHAAPGLVEMLYLTGSAALGDYQPGVSDIDFLAVTARPLELAARAVACRAGEPVQFATADALAAAAMVEAVVQDAWRRWG